MPIISVTMAEVDAKIKKELIVEVTRVSSEVTNIPKEAFHVLINELKDDNIGMGGKTLREVRAEML